MPPPRSSSVRRSGSNSAGSPTLPLPTSGSNQTTASPEPSPDVREGAISEANKRLLDEQLRTVESVIYYISVKSLSGFEAVLYILRNSVDVQRVATLEQLHPRLGDEVPPTRHSHSGPESSVTTLPSIHLTAALGTSDNGNGGPRMSVFGSQSAMFHSTNTATRHTPTTSRDTHEYVITTLCLAVSSYSPRVQIACAKGIADCVPTLAEGTLRSVYGHIARAVFVSHPSASERWVELLFAATKQLQEADIRSIVVPLMTELVSNVESPIKRVVGCRLAVAAIGDVPSLGLDLVPQLEALVGDPDISVRLALATSVNMAFLSLLPQVLVRESLFPSLLLPLLLDSNIATSVEVYNTLVDFCAVADPLFMRHCLSHVLQEYTLNPPPSVEPAVFKGFGKFIWHFRSCLTPADYAPLVRLFCSMCAHQSNLCRAECAFNFPAMFATMFELRRRKTPLPPVSPSSLMQSLTAPLPTTAAEVEHIVDSYHRDDESQALLVQRLASLVVDPAAVVRQRISAGFHEILLLALSQYDAAKERGGDSLGRTPCCSSDLLDETVQSSSLALLAELHSLGLRLLGDADLKVRHSTFMHLDNFLRCTQEVFGGDPKALQLQLNEKILPRLTFHETSISSNYRLVADFLPHFRLLPKYFSHDALDRHVVPRLVSHLITGAAAIKEDVAITIALTVRGNSPKSYDERIALASLRLVQNLMFHTSSTYRTALVWIARGFLEVFSAASFNLYFLPALRGLASDPVVSVRSAIVSLVAMTTPGSNARELLSAEVVPILVQDSDPILRKRAQVLVRTETRSSRRALKASDFSSLCDVIAAPTPKGLVSSSALARLAKEDAARMAEEGRLVKRDFMEEQQAKLVATKSPSRSQQSGRHGARQ